jgi:hypothetical protein
MKKILFETIKNRMKREIRNNLDFSILSSYIPQRFAELILSGERPFVSNIHGVSHVEPFGQENLTKEFLTKVYQVIDRLDIRCIGEFVDNEKLKNVFPAWMRSGNYDFGYELNRNGDFVWVIYNISD